MSARNNLKKQLFELFEQLTPENQALIVEQSRLRLALEKHLRTIETKKPEYKEKYRAYEKAQSIADKILWEVLLTEKV